MAGQHRPGFSGPVRDEREDTIRGPTLTPKNNSVARAFTILRAMGASGRDMTATEISGIVGGNLATVHRFLLSLEEQGAVSRTAAGRFRLGQALASLGENVESETLVTEKVQPHLERLATQFREAMHFAVRSGSHAVNTARAMPDRSLAIAVPLGEPLHLYCTAPGKIFLANMTRDARAAYFERTPMTAMTAHTLTDPEAFDAVLRQIATQGYALEDEEWEEGLRSVAVPLPNAKGVIVGAIALSAPASRLPDARIDDVVAAMRQTVAQLSSAHFSESRVFASSARPRGTYPHLKRVDDFIFLSGTSARRADDSFVGVVENEDGTVTIDIVRQTRATIEKIREMLQDVGARLNDVVDLQAYLLDMADYDAFNAVYAEYFDYDGPTRTTVAVRQLPHPHQGVMIRAVALAPRIPPTE